MRGAAPSPEEDPLSPWSAPWLLVFVATTGLGFFLVTLRYWIPTSTVRDATDEPIVDDRTHGDVVDRRPPRVAVVLFVLLLSAGGAGFLLGRWVGVDGTVVSRTATREVTVTQVLEVGILEERVRALPSQGRAGRPLELAWISGNNARTKERIEIYRQGQLIEVINTPLARTEAGVRYSVRWRPRAGESRRLRFCVRSTDAAGGEWPVSCARVLVLGESV